MLGSTVKTIGGIESAFYWGDKWNCQVVQFYLTLSRKWEVDEISKEKVKIFKDAWKGSKVKEIVAHIPYLVNLVSENKDTREKSLKRMLLEIERAKILGVRYLVLHPGSTGNQNKSKAIKVLRDSFKKIKPSGVEILIETMAGQGSSLGSSFEEIKEILLALNNDKVFGVCFDSAHVFESGYDIRGEGYEKTFREFKKFIPLKKIKAFHLNDSKTNFKSKRDRHEHIGKGQIGLDFFGKILNDERFKNIPKILETPEIVEEGENNLRILRNLIK